MNGHVISPIAGTSMVRGATRNLYMNPHFDYLSEMLPRDIKELFSLGVFPPCAPDSWACTPEWCGYWQLCRGRR